MKILARTLSIQSRSLCFPAGLESLSKSIHQVNTFQKRWNKFGNFLPSKPKFNSFSSLNKKMMAYYSQYVQAPRIRPSQLKTPVHEFLNAHQIAYIDGVSVYKIKYCPFCPKPHNDDRTNLFVLNVHKQFGYFHCFRCSLKGSWIDFRERVLCEDTQFTTNSFSNGAYIEPQAAAKVQRLSQAEYFLYKQDLWTKQYSDVLEYIRGRGFKDETIKAFNIGAGRQKFYDEGGETHQVKLVYFPLFRMKSKSDKSTSAGIATFPKDDRNNFVLNNNWSEISKVKMRGASSETKRFMRQKPVGNLRGLFGLNLVKDTDNTVVVTQGQFDAMAVYQETGMVAMSLPQGATNLPDNLLSYFDRFEKIILWMDNDEAGVLNTQKIAEKLGIRRTFIVKNATKKMKDANDFLQNDKAMISELLHKAKTIPESHLISFERMRSSIKSRMTNVELDMGVPVKWLPFFNQKVKGVRLGELTIVSGPTGSGKTTFLSQLFLDLCQRDIGVLWGSFQIRNEILVTHMLNQFCDLNLAKNIQKFEYFADKFQKLPLHMMSFFGSTNIQKILSTIIYTIEKHNIHCIVLDTLQFMLSEQGEGFKKFELQDTLMAKLRQISIKYHVHIAIVIHPRKTEESEDIGIHSIYGTSKATQQADNIWVIQNRDGFKLLDVKKNRYDGELGRIPLGFNKQSKKFFQLTRKQFEAIRNKEMTMRQIIQERVSSHPTSTQRPYKSQEERHMHHDKIDEHELKSETRSNYLNRY